MASVMTRDSVPIPRGDGRGALIARSRTFGGFISASAMAMAEAHGLGGADADAYAVSLEGRYTAAPVTKQPSPTPVLLAPRYYAVVSRMSELAIALTDQAVAQLTAPASQAPQPSPSPSGSARPTPTPTR